MPRHTHPSSHCVWLPVLLAGILIACSNNPTDGGIEPILGVSGSTSLLRDFALPQPLFDAGSPWNQTATTASVLPQSEQQILDTYRVLRQDTSYLSPGLQASNDWPFMYLNYDEYTIPVFRAGGGQQSVHICGYDGNLAWPGPKFPDNQQLGGPVAVPDCAGTVRPAGPQNTGSDGHLVLFDPTSLKAFDFWQATTQRTAACQSWGGGLEGSKILEAGAIDFFDVGGSGINLDGCSSARATGVPLLAGLLVPEDIESGAIAHALAFAIPGLRNTSPDPYQPQDSDYFLPASTTETDHFSTNPYALAAGQRIRLKQVLVDENGSALDENSLSPVTRMFLSALRTYGAYCVDSSGAFSFYAEDIHTANLNLTEDQVNMLIGQPPGTPLMTGKTRWQLVTEILNQDLEHIPIAYGPWTPGQDPATATIATSNFEVVENYHVTYSHFSRLPLVLRATPN